MTARRWAVAALLLPPLLLPLLTACDSTDSTNAPPAPTIEPGTTGAISLGSRPFQLHVPPNYDSAAAAPLVVLLHGYQAVGAAAQEAYFKLTAESDRRGFLYAMPEGTADPQGKKFWNATDACCDFYRAGIDDSTYLSRVIEKVEASYSVDATRVYLVGHSNGGFMAYRMACEHASQLTAVVSLAGAMNNDISACQPERPVSVLQVHGTADETISFGGGLNGRARYPSAVTTIAGWRQFNGCTGEADTSAPPIDLDARLPGAETTVTSYSEGCRNSTRVVLWSIKDGLHSPPFTDNFAPSIVDFLYSQVAPA